MRLFSLPALVFLLLCVIPAVAQDTSSITGRVTDPTGAIVAGASVRAINEATGLQKNTVTAADGHFRIPDLLAGAYELRVEQAGFRTIVRKGIPLSALAVLNLDLTLQVGDSVQSVEVTEEVPQVETTESRISQVVSSKQIQSLPAIGRGLMWLTAITPGVQGKAEDTRGGLCCDSMSSLASPALSSGGNERKANFFVDGVPLNYGDATAWNLAFTPNPDAVEEMRVSTNATSAADGISSGVQVQMTTKSGSNQVHGTGHYTFLDDALNALPYGSTSAGVGSWYQRFYGGTLGGPVIKDRLFFFGAFEGLREKRAASAGSTALVETEEFKDWVVRTRPNSIASQMLTTAPPFRYATTNLRDLNGDGIMDLGTVAMDRPTTRQGEQYNGRVDYQTASGRDRIYGSYWRTRPSQIQLDLRPSMDYRLKTGADLISAAHTHTFTPYSLNELRFSTVIGPNYDFAFVENQYYLPCVSTQDGISFPGSGCGNTYELQENRVYDIRDTFSWNKGSQSWKFGGSWRRVYMTDPSYQTGDTPTYNFTNLIDFANDNPFRETRAIDAATGKQRDPFVEALNRQLSFFAQNSWRVTPRLTLNLGVRWDYYYNHPLDGIERERNTYGPEYTDDTQSREGVLAIRNVPKQVSFSRDLNNFSPRISFAWDPTGNGRTAIRGGFFLLYDELNSLGLYRGFYGNPPISSTVQAGQEFGIPIVYGVAPVGTRDFPVNPGMVGPSVDPATGVFAGTRPNLTGFASDLKQPLTYDYNFAVQQQVATSLTLTAAYHHRRTSNDMYQLNVNRFSGDMVDGRLDRVNPYYGAISSWYNMGRRQYHGLVFEANKRFSSSWQLNASYSYHNSRSNSNAPGLVLTNSGATEVFQPDTDYARDEPATHNAKMNAVWDLPFFRGRHDFLGYALGGWQLATIWNYESGSYFNPVTPAQYGRGGDFNADGQTGDRPDLPAGDVPRSFSNEEWMSGALRASLFPLPATGDIRLGTLPRNYFVGPSYIRGDLSVAKAFPIREQMAIRFQAQASNLLNAVNIRATSASLTTSNFGMATGFYPMRTVQLSVKLMF